MNSAHLSTRIQAGPKQRPVSRRILGLGAGLVAALLLLIGIAFVHGGAANLMGMMGRANHEDATAPDTEAWLVTYSACDAPALAAPTTASLASAVVRVPVILAKDAILKLPEAPREVRQLINEVKIAPALLHAVIATESRYNTAALSPRGAIGLMQLMPDTALRFGAPDPYNTRDNILAGANYLKFLLKLFGNDMELALAAYNAGHGAVMRAGNRIPEYPETMAYVPKVLAYMRCASNAACRPV
jgi:soluble lytic murein transglycosylase-like protein